MRMVVWKAGLKRNKAISLTGEGVVSENHCLKISPLTE